MHRSLPLLLSVALIGCFDSGPPSGVYACSVDQDCPGGQVCRAPAGSTTPVCASPTPTPDTLAPADTAPSADTSASDTAPSADTAASDTAPSDTAASDTRVTDDGSEPPATDLTGDWYGRHEYQGPTLYLQIAQQADGAVRIFAAEAYGQWGETPCLGSLSGTHLYCSLTFKGNDGATYLVEGDFEWHPQGDALIGTWTNHKFIGFYDTHVTLGRLDP